MRAIWNLIMWASAFGLAIGLSHGAALLGHPTALWLWRDMLGLL